MPEDDDGSSLTSQRKVCSENLKDLLSWARAENIEVKRCAHCGLPEKENAPEAQRSSPGMGALDRHDPTRAALILRKLLPKGSYLDVLERLATSIRMAHSTDPRRWGVTLHEEQVRLNVGMPELFCIWPQEVYFFVVADSPPRIGTRLIEVDPSPYANLRGAFRVAGPAEAIATVYDQLRDHHKKAIALAAKRNLNPAAFKSHSPGVIQHLRTELRSDVPAPHLESIVTGAVAHGRSAVIFPDEVKVGEIYREGAVRRVEVNAYERDPAARKRCIEHYGAACSVCGFDFGAMYGEVVDGFIHVHHLRPLAEIGEEYAVDPVADLRPVCPNCHAVLHSQTPPLKIGDVQALLRKPPRQ
jgi:hypothetical protein